MLHWYKVIYILLQSGISFTCWGLCCIYVDQFQWTCGEMQELLQFKYLLTNGRLIKNTCVVTPDQVLLLPLLKGYIVTRFHYFSLIFFTYKFCLFQGQKNLVYWLGEFCFWEWYMTDKTFTTIFWHFIYFLASFFILNFVNLTFFNFHL